MTAKITHLHCNSLEVIDTTNKTFNIMLEQTQMNSGDAI